MFRRGENVSERAPRAWDTHRYHGAMWVTEDEAWKAFRDELRKALAEQNMTRAELARHLGDEVAESTIANWLQGTKVRIHLLPRIGAALGMGGTDEPGHDPAYLFRKMGLLPQEDTGGTYAIAYRVQKLEMRLREAIERTAAHGRGIGALADILQAVRGTREWAVAVWPAVEGPPSCRMHVADRLDLRRLDGREISAQDVTADPLLFRALRDGYAIPAVRQPRWTSADDPTVSRWSLMHVGSPSSPFVRSPHPGFQSIFCYATVIDSWVNDVASLLATALGYGLTTTRDLAMEANGSPLTPLWNASKSQAHSYLLQEPPRRRVWSHYGPVDGDCPNPFAARPGVSCVWVRESDELLAYASELRRVPEKNMLRDRDRSEALAARVPSNMLIVVDAELTAGIDERWEQVLRTVLTVFQRLENDGLLAAETRHRWNQQAESDPYVAAPMLAWLQQRLPNRRATRRAQS